MFCRGLSPSLVTVPISCYEKQRAGMSYFDAWQSAKAEKPELFND